MMMSFSRCTRIERQLLRCLCLLIWLSASNSHLAAGDVSTVTSRELPDAVLHNPDMGWVLYENHPVDPDPHGSSTMLTLPNESFPDVDAVAVMFSWQDVEKQPGHYDFSKVDFAYDHWARLGKSIQLRVSAESLLWWENRKPPAGKGVPDYVLAKTPADQKQTREMQGVKYSVVDARNAFYRERLSKFLRAVDAHFSAARPVSLIDLRGYGVWGEWHSGFKYAALEDRRAALKSILDLWSQTLPDHRLALSYSFDPDGPKQLYEGTTEKFDEGATRHYSEFLNYSAFDYAVTKTNITFRRDGCGGAVHSNERKLNEEAFRLGRGPMFSEFVDGFWQSKAGNEKWIMWKIEDALSSHPNYISLLGWQGADALAFTKERKDLVKLGLKRMGYRLVPTKIQYSTVVKPCTPTPFEVRWVNRGVGRALHDYELQLHLIDEEGKLAATTSAGTLETSHWAAGQEYTVGKNVAFGAIRAGDYELALSVRDPKSRRQIKLPIAQSGKTPLYHIGPIRVAGK